MRPQKTEKPEAGRESITIQPVRLNCFGFNDNQNVRLRGVFRGAAFFSASFTIEPEDPRKTDIYLAPSALIRKDEVPEALLLQESPPLLLMGPASDIRRAFGIGCGDFIRDPWSSEELLLRLERAVRYYRLPGKAEPVRFLGPNLCCGADRISLTPHESMILRILLRFNGEPVSRDVVENITRGGDTAHAGKPGRSTDVHIAALRKKLAPLFGDDPVPIRTAKGLGYYIDP